MSLLSVDYFPFPEGGSEKRPTVHRPEFEPRFFKRGVSHLGHAGPWSLSSHPNYFLRSASSASGSHTGAWQVKSLHT
jgi:hypothetical protein